MAEINTAAGLDTRAAVGITRRTPNNSRDRAAEQAGKALAVWLYCIGARSLEDTAELFRAHPEWRGV